MNKRKTMAERRAGFFATLEAFREATEKAGYLRGQRTAAPDTHDSGNARLREQEARAQFQNLHRKLITQFNGAVRVARTEARRG